MKTKRFVYFVEGQCEEKLITALKKEPSLIQPGKCNVLNPISEKLSPNDFITVPVGSIIIFVFDTDVANNTILEHNMKMVKRYAPHCEIVLIPQVMTIEDELLRATIVKKVEDLTRSKSLANFKSDFCALKNCRNILEKYKLDMSILWSKKPDGVFDKYPQQSSRIKKS